MLKEPHDGKIEKHTTAFTHCPAPKLSPGNYFSRNSDAPRRTWALGLPELGLSLAHAGPPRARRRPNKHRVVRSARRQRRSLPQRRAAHARSVAAGS